MSLSFVRGTWFYLNNRYSNVLQTIIVESDLVSNVNFRSFKIASFSRISFTYLLFVCFSYSCSIVYLLRKLQLFHSYIYNLIDFYVYIYIFVYNR